ncbi:hypothetical protein ACIQU6_26140 [Streptomyces sp. NPDC090442]|uniref:hypothetical protein n=1 Tax=Streptomyces sp. NPDC090442 TaxID=3365962 RepID=UPI0037F57775
MSDGAPVDPFEVPVFTGDLDLLESKVKALSHGGPRVETAGSNVHKSFGGLSAFYKAPEAEQLFGVTKPVADKAHEVSHDMGVIAGALGTYAHEVRPLVDKLKQLKQDAADFRHKVNGSDNDWREDSDLVTENRARRDTIATVWAAFQAAERDCHTKIVGLVGGKPLHTIDASHPGGYGYDAKTLTQAKSLPWGDAVEESVPWWKVWDHAYEFGKGVIIDGAWGAIRGLGTLIGVDGWDAAKQAWTNLAKLATTTALLGTMPALAPMYFMTPGRMLPSWLRDSRTAMVEAGKAFVAWDQWKSNAPRAAGAVAFNVVTAIITRGGGAAVEGAGKAGAAVRAVSIAGKVGEVIDPMTYVFKGAGAGISKIGDVMARFKDAGHFQVPKISEGAYSLPEGATKLHDGTVQMPKDTAVPEGATKLPNGNIRLPEGTVTLPPKTVKDPFTGNYTDSAGHLYGKDGSLLQHADDAPKSKSSQPAVGADNPRIEAPVNQKEPALASVGGRGDDAMHVGSDVTNPTRASDNAGTLPTGDKADHTPTNSHTPGGEGGTSHTPISGGLDNSPSAAGHTTDTGGTGSAGHGSGDGPSTPHQGDGPGHAGDHTPGGAGEEHASGGSGADLPPGDAGTSLPDAPRGNLPDGSWEGENGLSLSREENAAAGDFMRKSAEAEPRITESMQEIAGKADAGKLIGLEYRLKGEDSLKRKLATDMLEDIGMDHGQVLSGIKDSIRYTMEVPSKGYAHGVQQAINDLQAKGFENVTFKNTWNSAGYKGINSTWRDPVSGQVFELQFHTSESFAAKMDGHVLYEKERLPGVSPQEIAAIKAEQAELFGKVPVPHDAGAIRIGAHAADDAAAALGKDLDSTAHDLGPVGDDVGSLGNDAAHADGLGNDALDNAGTSYTHGPNGGWGGAGWVEQPSAYAAGVYDSLRATPNHVDVPAMARNTGLNEAVIRQVKTHMIRQLHDVVVRPGEWKRGLFTPRDDIAALWDGARKGTLDTDQVVEFKNLMTHEYVESRLMKSGLPYLRDETGLWRWGDDGDFEGRKSPKSLSAAGAHDLAPNPVRGGFGTQWQKLGLKHPKTDLAADLSNIDDFVKDIVQELRAKGLDLK